MAGGPGQGVDAVRGEPDQFAPAVHLIVDAFGVPQGLEPVHRLAGGLLGNPQPSAELPAPVAMLASSPHPLDGFLRLSKLFEATTLAPVAREVVVMTVATRNGCEVCVAMHTAKLTSLGATADVRLAPAGGLTSPRRSAAQHVVHHALPVRPGAARHESGRGRAVVAGRRGQ